MHIFIIRLFIRPGSSCTKLGLTMLLTLLLLACLLHFGTKVLQLLRWRCADCAVYHERNIREEQHQYIRGANKQ